MRKERNIALCIIWSIASCGIYGIYWFIVLTDEAKIASKDESAPSGGLSFVLTLVSCGLYGLYWAYKMGKTLAKAKSNVGLSADDNSVLYLILQLFGLSIIGYALMQNDLNEITRKEAGVTQA